MPGDDIESWAFQVHHLLNGHCDNLLRASAESFPFSSIFFQYFITDMLSESNFNLWEYVEYSNLNTMFALGAMAVVATLKDFQEGHHVPLDAAEALWRGNYIHFVNLTADMCKEETQCMWLNEYQRALIAQTCACLGISAFT